MYLEDIEKRISHIQENIKATTSQVQSFTTSLQQATQQLSSLQGHLNESMYWKQQYELEETNSMQSQLVPVGSEGSGALITDAQTLDSL